MVGTMMCRHIHATIWQCTLDGPSLGLSMTMYSHQQGVGSTVTQLVIQCLGHSVQKLQIQPIVCSEIMLATLGKTSRYPDTTM